MTVFLLAAACGLLLAVGVAARLTTRPRWAIPVALLGGVGFAYATIPPAAAGPTVTLLADTTVRTGNGLSYPPRLELPLPRGTRLDELHRRGGWVQVRLPTGEIGWVPADVVR